MADCVHSLSEAIHDSNVPREGPTLVHMADSAEALSEDETLQRTQSRIGRDHLVSFGSPGCKEGSTVEGDVRVYVQRKSFVTGEEMLFGAYGNEGRREV